MGITEFLLLLLVAAIIGAIGEAVAGFSPGGCAMSTVVGFVGALIGRWLQRALHMPTWFVVKVGGHSFAVVWAVIGSALLVTVLRLLRPRRARL